MGRIAGHIEWDNDDLAPGHKKEGGLHQNLYDADGQLRGSARFIPGDPDSEVVTETVFIPATQRHDDDDVLAQIVEALISGALMVAKPHVEQWVTDKLIPAVGQRTTHLRNRFARRTEARKRPHHNKNAPSGQRITDDAAPMIDPSSCDAVAYRPHLAMSKAEAQARYLAALAAHAFTADQLRLITDANVFHVTDDISVSLTTLPTEQVTQIVTTLVQNPALLSEDNLAQLADVLAHPDSDHRALDAHLCLPPPIQEPL